MSDFNLDGFQEASKVRVGVKTKKAGSAVSFDLKYRDGSFSFSPALWDKLGLNDKAIKILINTTTNQVALKLVENDLGTIFKRTPKTGDKKFRKAKAVSIETALVAAGLITKTEKVKGVESHNQYLGLQDIGNDSYLITAASVSPVAVAPEIPATVQEPQVEATTTAYEAPVVDQVASSDDLLHAEVSGGSFEEAPEEPEAEKEDEDFDEKF